MSIDQRSVSSTTPPPTTTTAAAPAVTATMQPPLAGEDGKDAVMLQIQPQQQHTQQQQAHHQPLQIILKSSADILVRQLECLIALCQSVFGIKRIQMRLPIPRCIHTTFIEDRGLIAHCSIVRFFIDFCIIERRIPVVIRPFSRPIHRGVKVKHIHIQGVHR